MRNFIQITLLFLVITHLSFSQELTIKDLKLDPLDLSARSNEKKDVNGEVCALLIVNTNLTDLFFDGEIVEVIQQETGGYWVYLPPRVKKIKVLHKDFLPNELILPIAPKSYDVFNVTIFANKYNVQNNLNRLTFILNEANVYISSNGLAPIFTPGNNAVFDLPNGKHTFVISKNGFKPEIITVDLKEAQTIKVNLVQGDNTINFPLNSFVIVDSEPIGADVLLNGQKVGITPYQGKNTAGEYVLSLNYPLFYSHELSFKVKEGDSYTVPTVKLKPNFGYLQIKTNPTDAELIIDGKKVKNNYPEKLKIKSGYHSIVVKKSMYEEEKISLNLKDEELKPLEVDLKPNYTSISIQSEPQGAKVLIDNNYVGTTPYVNDKIGFGNYSITLQKDLYMDYREDILIGSDAKIEKNIVLTKNYGTLNITAKDADIYIDGLKVASNNYSIKLKSGTYKIKASKEYHTDHEVEVFLTNGQTENLILSPVPKMGALSIVTNPFEAKNATIYINNQKQTQTTPAIIPIIIGEQKVVVEKKGYISQQKSVVIKQSEEKELVFNLQSFNGSLEQKIKNQTLGKNIFKISTLLLAATGGYYLYANENLYTEYTNATTNATEIYDKIQLNNQIATVSFASVLPSVIMWKIKSNQIKKNKAKIANNSTGTAYGNQVGFTTTYQIGQIGPAGGYVFYDKGNNDGGWRYLEAAPTDQSTGAIWGCYGTSVLNTQTSIGSGKQNTAIIAAGCNESNIAAKICDDLILGGKEDWFLPSIDELKLMYKNLHKNNLGYFKNSNYYWSSTESSGSYAWNYSFYYGNADDYYSSKSYTYYVRAVRAF